MTVGSERLLVNSFENYSKTARDSRKLRIAYGSMKINDIVSTRVRELRVACGWKQDELGKRLSELGIDRSMHYVSQIETQRKAKPSVGEVAALALALEVSPLALLTPRSEADTIEVTPKARMEGGAFRDWMHGRMSSWRSADIELSGNDEEPYIWSWWTIDDQPEDDNIDHVRRAGMDSMRTEEELAAYEEFGTAKHLVGKAAAAHDQVVNLHRGVKPNEYLLDIDEQLQFMVEDIERLRTEIRRFRSKPKPPRETGEKASP